MNNTVSQNEKANTGSAAANTANPIRKSNRKIEVGTYRDYFGSIDDRTIAITIWQNDSMSSVAAISRIEAAKLIASLAEYLATETLV